MDDTQDDRIDHDRPAASTHKGPIDTHCQVPASALPGRGLEWGLLYAVLIVTLRKSETYKETIKPYCYTPYSYLYYEYSTRTGTAAPRYCCTGAGTQRIAAENCMQRNAALSPYTDYLQSNRLLTSSSCSLLPTGHIRLIYVLSARPVRSPQAHAYVALPHWAPERSTCNTTFSSSKHHVQPPERSSFSGRLCFGDAGGKMFV